MSSRRQRSIPLGGRYRQVSLYSILRNSELIQFTVAITFIACSYLATSFGISFKLNYHATLLISIAFSGLVYRQRAAASDSSSLICLSQWCIMWFMMSEITGNSTVCPSACAGDQRALQDSTSPTLCDGRPTQLAINLSHPRAAYRRHGTGSALVQTIACRMFGTKTLQKTMWGLGNCTYRNNLQWNSNQIQQLSFMKMHVKMSSAKKRPFCQVEMS